MKKQTLFYLSIGLSVLSVLLTVLTVLAGLRIAGLSAEVKKGNAHNAELTSQIQSLNKEYQTLENSYAQLEADQTAKNKNAKIAYLTFDDGPCRLTGHLLDTLKASGVHATFFIVGKNAQQNPGILNRMVAEGNVVGIHSWTHRYDYIYANTNNFFEDFDRLKDFITTTTGISPQICRFPGGTNNTVSFHYDAHIMQQIEPKVVQMGIKPYDWNVDSGDAVTNVPPKDTIVQTVINQSRQHRIAVILLHDADQHESSIDAIPEIVTQLKRLGYQFETLNAHSPTVEFKPS